MSPIRRAAGLEKFLNLGISLVLVVLRRKKLPHAI